MLRFSIFAAMSVDMGNMSFSLERQHDAVKMFYVLNININNKAIKVRLSVKNAYPMNTKIDPA